MNTLKIKKIYNSIFINPFFLYAIVWSIIVLANFLNFNTIYPVIPIDLIIFFIFFIIISICIGIYVKNKYSYIKKLREQLDTVFQRSYCFLYLQSKLVFFYNKLTNREFKKAKMKEFSFKKISSSKVREISLQSKYIIDATMFNQNGLPFRIFEALHMKKKLITNNENIKKYPFYTPDNILIYKDGDKIELSSSFFTTPFNEEYSVDDTYSGKSFIRELLNIKD